MNGSAHRISTSTASILASYPGLLTPVFVACSTSTGEGVVKTESRAMTYLDV